MVKSQTAVTVVQFLSSLDTMFSADKAEIVGSVIELLARLSGSVCTHKQVCSSLRHFLPLLGK